MAVGGSRVSAFGSNQEILLPQPSEKPVSAYFNTVFDQTLPNHVMQFFPSNPRQEMPNRSNQVQEPIRVPVQFVSPFERLVVTLPAALQHLAHLADIAVLLYGLEEGFS